MPTSVKDIYSDIICSKALSSAFFFSMALWKTGCPPRMIFFASLVFNNRNLTWDNLRKRNWHGPSRCSMCESEEETNLHMFFHCNSTQEIWYELAILFDFPLSVFVSVHAAFQWWSSQCESRRPILIIMIRCAWRWRNHKIFRDSKAPYKSILHCISSFFDSISSNRPNSSG